MVNLVPIPNSLSTSMVPSCASIITFAIQHNCTSYRLAYRINPSSPITAALNYARQNRKQPVGLESTITLIHTLHQKIRGSGGLKSPTKIPSKLLSANPCPVGFLSSASVNRLFRLYQKVYKPRKIKVFRGFLIHKRDDVV